MCLSEQCTKIFLIAFRLWFSVREMRLSTAFSDNKCTATHRPTPMRRQEGAGGADAPPRATGKNFCRQFLLKWGKNWGEFGEVHLRRWDIGGIYNKDMTMQKKVMTKKRHQLLVRKSAPPQRKSWLRLCGDDDDDDDDDDAVGIL